MAGWAVGGVALTGLANANATRPTVAWRAPRSSEQRRRGVAGEAPAGGALLARRAGATGAKGGGQHLRSSREMVRDQRA